MAVLTTLLVLQISAGILFVANSAAADCNFTLSYKLDPKPIVVTSNDYQFLYPAPGDSGITVKTKEQIIISCPGSSLTIGGTSYGTTITATCVGGLTFAVGSSNFSFNSINCLTRPQRAAIDTRQSCEKIGREIKIGFNLTNVAFAPIMSICFDFTKYTPLYSKFELTRSVGYRETNISRSDFIGVNFYNLGVNIGTLYDQQTSTINKLLNVTGNYTKYISKSGNFYLSRGHLTAQADFVYAPQQKATFYYVNTCPQWQTFNGNNWNTAEINVRDYAKVNKLNLMVYTGCYGVTTLPHETTKKEIPLYLYVDNNGNNALPVPELFWKVVYEPKKKAGVVLLGINNPYQTNVTKSIICKDISSSIKWLSWRSKDLTAGYSYACALNDTSLKAKISYLPQFGTNALLL